MRCLHCGFDDPEDFPICTECGQPRGPVGPAVAPFGGMQAGPMPQPAMAQRGMPDPWPAYPAPPVGDQGRAACLQGMEGPVEGLEFALDRPEMSVGRRSDCDIAVSDQSVSRVHAVIRIGPAGYIIEDQNSANGTWVNGVRLVSSQPLVERDVIRIGKAAFTFRSEIQAPPMPPGSMTMVDSMGPEPDPFGGNELAQPWGSPAAAQLPAVGNVRPPPEPVAFPTPPAPPPPAVHVSQLAGAGAVAPGAASPKQRDELQDQLAELRRDLGPFIQRLNTLSDAVSSLEGQLAASPPPPAGPPPQVRQLLTELEADGGIERYRELERLLDKLRADPNDLKLLLRLSEELPTINRLVQIYLRALSLVQEMLA